MNWGTIIVMLAIVFAIAYWWESNEMSGDITKLDIIKAALFRALGIVLFVLIFGGMIHLLDGDRGSRPSCGGNRYVGYDDCYDNY